MLRSKWQVKRNFVCIFDGFNSLDSQILQVLNLFFVIIDSYR
jgi:hypothetical protein